MTKWLSLLEKTAREARKRLEKFDPCYAYATVPQHVICSVLQFRTMRELHLFKRVNRHWHAVLQKTDAIRLACCVRFPKLEFVSCHDTGLSGMKELRFASYAVSESKRLFVPIMLYSTSQHDPVAYLWNPEFKKSSCIWISFKGMYHGDAAYAPRLRRIGNVMQCGAHAAMLLHHPDAEDGPSFFFAQMSFDPPAKLSNRPPFPWYLSVLPFEISMEDYLQNVVSMGFVNREIFTYQWVQSTSSMEGHELRKWVGAYCDHDWEDESLQWVQAPVSSGAEQFLFEKVSTARVHRQDQMQHIAESRRSQVLYISQTKILLLNRSWNRLRIDLVDNPQNDKPWWINNISDTLSVELASGEQEGRLWMAASERHICVLNSSRWRFFNHQGFCIVEQAPLLPMEELEDVTFRQDPENLQSGELLLLLDCKSRIFTYKL